VGTVKSFERPQIAAGMTPRTTNTTAGRPNRILIALATAWVILSLAIGGAANPGADQASQTRVSADQPARP